MLRILKAINSQLLWKKISNFSFTFVAVDLQTMRDRKDLDAAKPRKVKTGLLSPNANVQFQKAEGSSVNLVGRAVG